MAAVFLINSSFWPHSQALIHEALALNPNSVHILALAAVTLPYTGKPEEAARLADVLCALIPVWSQSIWAP
jgi:hypothetical protein